MRLSLRQSLDTDIVTVPENVPFTVTTKGMVPGGYPVEAAVGKAPGSKFPPLAPEFIIEVMSPSDRLKDAKKKMEEWRRGGVELGWLIQADRKTVYIYHSGRAQPGKRTGIKKVKGEGLMAGFELDLTVSGLACGSAATRSQQ